jgi:hypothetical protein
MYGQSNIDVSRRIPTFFGFSTSLTTLATRTAAMSQLLPYYVKVKEALSTQLIRWRDDSGCYHESYVFMACYDNLQKNTKFKFQRDGKTSNFVKVTARMFVQMWQGLWQQTLLPNSRVSIEYVGQIIPSPVGMPPFELSKVPTQSLLSGHTLKQRCIDMKASFLLSPTVDFTGQRVNEYIRHMYRCKEFKCQRRFLLLGRNFAHEQPLYKASRRRLLNVYLELSHLRSCGGFYAWAEHFQRHMAEIMRGDRPKVKLLPLPAVKDDETTLRGTSGVVVKFLLLSGLVRYEKGRYELADDIANHVWRRLIMRTFPKLSRSSD